MGHFAQYRKRGGSNQGFIIAAPTVAQWTAGKSTTHTTGTVAAGPGSGILSLIVISYLLGSPSTINETYSFLIPGNGTGPFTYTIGVSVVGVRAAWSFDGVRPASPFSAEQQLSF